MDVDDDNQSGDNQSGDNQSGDNQSGDNQSGDNQSETGSVIGACVVANIETRLVAGGRDERPGSPINVPPVFASNFAMPGDHLYSRVDGTDTSLALESLLGDLEGGRALVFGSGMAAASAVFGRLPVGATVLAPADPYHGVNGLLAEGEAQGRWQVVRLEQADTEAWIDALPSADLVWLESPENPLLTVADLPAVCSAPRPDTTLVAVDSTFATPLLQSPLDYGADVVMHSATKFIGGHSDLLAGALVTQRDDLWDELWNRRLLYGATIGAMEAFLAIRGARTLAVRLERAQANAAELADRLAAHRHVAKVRYPGRVDHPTHAVAASFMSGFGAMVSFDTSGTPEQCEATCRSVELITHATSLGGVESIMERRAALGGQERIPPTLIRFSVGIEHVDDLWADLDQALVEGHR